MATWQQSKAATKLYSPVFWNVVSDPPGRCRTITQCSTQAEAESEMAVARARGERYLYILKPYMTGSAK